MPEPDLRFQLRRLSDRSDQSLITEVQRVAHIISGPITRDAFSKEGKVSPTTLERRFGTWDTVLRKAGLEDRIHPNKMRLSDEQTLQELRMVADKLGKTSITVKDVEDNSSVTGDRLRRRWGNAKNAFAAAGVSSTPLGKRYDDEERFENLLEVWTHYGRPPQYREMYSPPSSVGGKAYTLRFGSWIGALEAFVERVNAGDPKTTLEPKNTPEPKKASSVTEIGENRGSRDVPLGLRFKVLQRDRFRCLLCGNNPPIDPSCVLHIDHIQPWSLGGSTIIENLRTLCAKCNVGRSNRYAHDDNAVSGGSSH